jgi:hypothetical protein
MPRSNGQLALITLAGTALSAGYKTYALELPDFRQLLECEAFNTYALQP